MRAPTAKETSGKRRIAVIGILTVVFLAIAIFIVRRRWPAAPPADPVNPADAPIVDKLGQGAEAREWLKADEGRSLSGMNHKQSVFKIDQWYDLGAQRAIVFGRGSSVGFELPSDPAKRKAVFEFQKKWNADNNFPVVTDNGQKWIEIQMRL